VRILVALALTGCSADHGTTHPPDAPTVVLPDADAYFCDAPAHSSTISIVIGGVPTGFMRVHAGGTIFAGPVAPVAPVDRTAMSLMLLFIDEDHVAQSDALNCFEPHTACTLDGVLGEVDSINELGPHPIRLDSLQHGVTVQGTLTITDFTHPYDAGPGHIAGSIATPDNSVSGSFGNDFCGALLSVTI
jgi:hypothetical protein